VVLDPRHPERGMASGALGALASVAVEAMAPPAPSASAPLSQEAAQEHLASVSRVEGAARVVGAVAALVTRIMHP
jgi:hypothetical protein